MARILNLLVVILDLVGFAIVLPKRGKENWVYYTQLSNAVAGVTSLLLVIFGPREWTEVLRYLGVCMLAMTFVVTVFILIPMGAGIKRMLFHQNGLYHHVLCPVISIASYLFVEPKATLGWIVLPVLVTLLYGIVMVVLNAKGRVEGPYPFLEIRKIGGRKTALWIAMLFVLISVLSFGTGFQKLPKSDLKYVYVHGLAGWGSYDLQNEFIPYWGMTTGDLMRYLNLQGYDSYAASVDPTGSAWDRACELYAELTGSRVDYGEEHSKRCNHERFGEDFSGRALLKDFESSRFVLIGHSFGGATIRLFSELYKNGSEAERAATKAEDLSPFFAGGGGDNLVALVTLAAPTNGTTAYDLYEDPDFDPASVPVPEAYEAGSNAVSAGTKPNLDGRIADDYASYDMHIDHALALNEQITTFEDVYYFAIPLCSTRTEPNGYSMPDPAITEGMFRKGSVIMGHYTGKTAGGYELDEAWQPNDGLVNTISAGAPFGAPEAPYVEGSSLKPGIWYVYPVMEGDHMSLQGGFSIRKNVRPFYLELAKMLSSLDLS